MTLSLFGIIALAALFRLFDMERAGLGNLFYASTVYSMGLSFFNFWFAAYEPLGSFMVDKPPLALWVQTGFTKVLGFNGTAMILPMALAGIAGVGLVFVAARHTFGSRVALLAALVLAIFPESVGTARDSTMDAFMMAMLALAAVILIRAADRPSLRWLLVWAVLMGLVFNVKYFEGFVAMPAFVLYVLVAWRQPLRKAIPQWALAGIVLTVVSLAWVTAVELAPTDTRPRVMNDPNNSLYGLIINYNGLDRVLHRDVPIFQTQPGGRLSPGAVRYGVGDAGPLRLFTSGNGPLMGMTVLLAIVGIIALLSQGRKNLTGPPLLWMSWGVTGILLFSASNRAGAHYTESYAPALAVLAGVGLAALVRAGSSSVWIQLMGTTVLGGLALYAIESVRDFPPLTGPTEVAAYVTVTTAIAATVVRLIAPLHWARPLFAAVALGGILAVPAIASSWIAVQAPRGSTITAPNPLFDAQAGGGGGPQPSQAASLAINYVKGRNDARYTLATNGFNRAGDIIARFQVPVLPIWGEYLQQPLFSTEELAALVERREVRYFLMSNRRPAAMRDLSRWLSQNCTSRSNQANITGLGILWDCSQDMPS